MSTSSTQETGKMPVPRFTDQEKAAEAAREVAQRRAVYPRINLRDFGNADLRPKQIAQIEMMEEIAAEYRERARVAAELVPPKPAEPEQLELLG